MKRKLFMVAIAAISMCVMVSCGKKDNKASDEKTSEGSDNTEQVVEGDEEDEDDGDVAPEVAMKKVLESAYEDLNVIYGSREDDLESNLDIFGMYCTEGFNRLITDTRAVDYNQELEEDRFFRGNELTMWSPWEDGPLSIDDVTVEMNGDEYANVTYNLHHGDEWINMGVEFEFENGQWRIKDFTKAGDVEDSMEVLMITYLRSNER